MRCRLLPGFSVLPNRSVPFLFFFSLLLIPVQAQRRYLCSFTAEVIAIDGRLDEKAWQEAKWTEPFVDIRGLSYPRPRFRTRAKMLWDDKNFYICAELREPHVWATLRTHDSVIYHDNDFEIFFDPDGDGLHYFEFEINAWNTGWDLFLPRPYNRGGKADNSWDIDGLRTAVRVQGKRNDPQGLDEGWTVEMSFPWTAFRHQEYQAPTPVGGDVWRINFSRVEWRQQILEGKYKKVPQTPEDNWVWSPQGEINMHIPEKWGYVHFIRHGKVAGKKKTESAKNGEE